MKRFNLIIKYALVACTCWSQISFSKVESRQPGQALNKILAYLNEASYSYKIDYPWIEKTPSQTDLEVLQAIESQLKQKFSEESGNQVNPGWIHQQSIQFERREVCVEFAEAVTKDNQLKLKVSNTITSGSINSRSETVSNTVAAGLSRAQANVTSAEKIQLNASITDAVTMTKSNGSYKKQSGYTVYEVVEREKMVYCKTTRIDYRGTLQAEKNIRHRRHR